MNKLSKFLVSVIGCELVGIVGSQFTFSAIPTWYAGLEKPFFSPPNWLFAPVWTLLYLMMGISVYLIWEKGWQKQKVKLAVKVFLAQLVLNFFWSILFFGLKSPLFGLIDILAMWTMIVLTIRHFYPLNRTAAYLLVPYLIWVSFATILNAAILLLN